MKLSSVKPAIKFILQARKILSRPRQSEVLIFDREGSEDFLEYFPIETVSILEVRGESVNIVVLFSAILKYGIKINVTSYIREYLNYVNPKAIITFIDNTKNFYELKEHFRNGKFISIQNGWRDDTLFEILKLDKHCLSNLKADMILCFGSAVANKYMECVDAEVLPIGSFKSNKVARRVFAKSAKPTVLFLSQYRTPVMTEVGPAMPVGERNIPWDTFYAAELSVLPFLKEYCKKNNFDLKVCGGSDNTQGNEEKYFRNILGDEDWQYLPRNGTYDSYKRVDEVEFVVFIDSTLGFEALGRGAKAASFSIRGVDLEVNDRSFGYHADLPLKGPFWTSYNKLQDFQDVMDFITSVGDEQWLIKSSPVISKIMQFDPGNTRFLEIIHNAGVQINN